MPLTTVPGVAVLPTPPSTLDIANFDTRADAWNLAIPTFSTQMVVLAGNAYGNASYAFDQANLAVVARQLAQQAVIDANNAASAAATYANASRWVSGGTYAVDAVRFSPATGLVYRAIQASAGRTVDPSTDTAYWSPALTVPVAAGGTGAITAVDARTNLDVPNRAGSGATGNWGIGITGNAATATLAATATSANALNQANNYSILNRITFSHGTGAGFIASADATWGFIFKPSVDGTSACYLFAGSGGGILATLENNGKFSATTMVATTFVGSLNGSISGNAATANNASGQVFSTSVATTGESAFVAQKAGRGNIAMINNDLYCGLYSADGGLLVAYDRTSGLNELRGHLNGVADSATNATYAGTAGSVNTLSAYQVGIAVSQGGVYDLGAYMFGFNVTGTGVGIGTYWAGSDIRPANDNGNIISGSVPPGTWICCGYAPGGSSTLWKRVA